MSLRDLSDAIAVGRREAALVLRRLDMEPFIRACENLAHGLEIKAFSIAQRIDPRPADPWMTVGTDDGDYERFAEEILRPMQDAVGAMLDQTIDRMMVENFVPVTLPTPFVHESSEHILRPDILEQVREASERGEVLTPQQLAALKVDEVKFAPFDQTDMQPYIDLLDSHIAHVAGEYRDAAERHQLFLLGITREEWDAMSDEQREAVLKNARRP